MPDPRQSIHALLRGLVLRLGKQDAAAKMMADYWSETGSAAVWDAGDLSRKMHGTRRWTIDDMLALQALTGSTAVTDLVCELGQVTSSAPGLSGIQHATRLIKEHGEASVALLEGGDAALQLKELIDLRDAVAAAIGDLQAEGEA
ncbi:hypothetical protein [Pseudoroseicyclus sp. CXY001]|uniref:hypothetical protein n=1 Tax=Pseudoroseicyclus sp. CXY001 TaxID=3242492 RepID=UPI0035714DF7